MAVCMLALLLAPPQSMAGTPTDSTVGFYHGAPNRAGHYVVPGLTWQSVAGAHRDQAFDGRVNGHIYAQPLYWRPSGEEHGLVIAATENNNVVALDAASGVLRWQAHLGRSVSASMLPCGNIDPLGITGTPVINQAQGAIYLDAMVDNRGAPRHLVYGLRLTDGAVLPGFPIDVAAQLAARGVRFDPATQNQRGALALMEDRVLIPFGGHYGDCGDYHGTVVAIATDKPRLTAVWTTRAPKGGIWAPAGLSAADGSLFFATGNTKGVHDWQDGEGAFRVDIDLAHSTSPQDVFVPPNWKELDQDDLDLGGVTPLPLTLPGNTMKLLMALGKDGNAYLLDRTHLGGIGGALAVYRAAEGIIITAAAAYPVGGEVQVIYQANRVVCPDGRSVSGLGSLTVTAQSGKHLRSAWCARLDGGGAPIVTTSDGSSDPIVWVVGAQGDDRLHGYRGDTGQEIYSGSGSDDRLKGLRHLATILAAAGRFYVAGDGRIYAFTLPH